MTRPVRIQLSRAKGWRMPAGAVKVDRTTPWGNPFKVDGTRMRRGDWMVFQCTDGRFGGPPKGFYPTAKALAACVEFFRRLLESPEGAALRQRGAAELQGKNPGCWCAIGTPCHADVWLEIANPKKGPTDAA